MDETTLRKLVWEEMLYADMRANYFGELVRRYLLLDRTLRVATLIATSGSVAAVLVSSGPGKLIVPITATAISFWLLVSQYGSMARDAGDLHEGWGARLHRSLEFARSCRYDGAGSLRVSQVIKTQYPPPPKPAPPPPPPKPPRSPHP